MKRVFIISLALLAASCGPGDWLEIRSKEGRFAIKMPAAPEENMREIETSAGPIALRVQQLEHGGFDYMVGFSDYPDEVLAAREPASILDGARDGAIASIRGKLLAERAISLGEHIGRAVSLLDESGEQILQMRLLLVGKRLYQFGIATPTRDRSAEEVARFLDSFALLQN